MPCASFTVTALSAHFPLCKIMTTNGHDDWNNSSKYTVSTEICNIEWLLPVPLTRHGIVCPGVLSPEIFSLVNHPRCLLKQKSRRQGTLSETNAPSSLSSFTHLFWLQSYFAVWFLFSLF